MSRYANGPFELGACRRELPAPRRVESQRRSSAFVGWAVAALAGVMLAAWFGSGARAIAGETPCAGDCNTDQQVTIGELIIGVNIALQQREVSDCPSFDGNGDGAVMVNELISAVSSALAGCGGDAIERGLASLAAGNLVAANQAFAAAAAANPSDSRANLYVAATRLATSVLGDARVLDLLARSGVTVTGGLEDICALDAIGPDVLPPTAPRSGEILDTGRAVLQPALNAALASLERIAPGAVVGFDLRRLPPCFHVTGRVDVVEIDRGDVLALTALLEGVDALADTLTAYDLDFSLAASEQGSFQTLFESEPRFLTLRSAERLASARTSWSAALTAAEQTIDAVRAEQDDQSDDVLVILPEDAGDADRTKQTLQLVRQSLDGEVILPTAIGLPEPHRLNLRRLFSAQFQSLRRFVAVFEPDGGIDTHRFPDPTFGGTLPDVTQRNIDEFITGGPLCAPCQSEVDCDGFGLRELSCTPCAFECTGTVMRCADTNDLVRCDDGLY